MLTISNPTLLVSYAHLREHHVPMPGHGFAEWTLDSGAYTAHNSGKTIRNEDFIRFALRAKKLDPRLVCVFGLDVIGDPEASLRNALEAKAAGLEVLPTWHAGEPLEFAQEMAKQFDKVALGGLVARLKNNRAQLFDTGTKLHHAMKFFHAVWPKWIHGFGCTAEDLMTELPFAATDSTTWTLRPSMYGSWKSFGFLPLRLSSDTKDCLRTEVEWFLDREALHDAQWRSELVKVKCDRFRIRLACSVSNVKDVSRMFAPEEDTAAAHLAAQVEEQVQAERGAAPAPDEETMVSPKSAVKSAELSPTEFKWANYWQQRGVTKDNVDLTQYQTTK